MANATDRLYERLLVLRCQAGDQAAFEELIRRYDQRLRYYLRRMLPGEDRVADALQETWFDVFRKAPRLRDPAAFPAWLYRIARNHANLQHRRAPRQEEPLLEENLRQTDTAEEFSAEDAAGIHAALGRLSPEHREVLVLRFMEQMTYEQIAEVTGSRLGTVQSRIHYAKAALRRELGDRP